MESFENLDLNQRQALYLRFWENKTVFEIGQRLGLSWGDADEAIESALRVLRRISMKRAG